MLTTIGQWQVYHQPATTAECYATLPVGNGCDCADCVRFVDSVARVFPREFHELLTSFGIDPRKPAELCHYEIDDSGLRRIEGWYHLVGVIREGRDCWKPFGESNWIPDFELFRPHLEIGLTNCLWLVRPPFNRHALVQLEFVRQFSWGTAGDE